MFNITLIIFIPITKQPEQNRLAENQPTAGLSSLNEYENEYENGMRKSETELIVYTNWKIHTNRSGFRFIFFNIKQLN